MVLYKLNFGYIEKCEIFFSKSLTTMFIGPRAKCLEQNPRLVEVRLKSSPKQIGLSSRQEKRSIEDKVN